ncbi:MAG TPA: dynamin family protein [Chloroflexota bacterium]|nr:dynamin family protein [Chloroflexota bacterium]
MPLTEQTVLTDDERTLLADERSALADVRELLARHHANEVDTQLIRQAERDLDELFLLVVVGEFNAGKSAFINALVGAPVLREGVTPTTAVITRVGYAETQQEQRDGALLRVGYPLDLLRETAIIDTPGTNAILREHEEITERFIPRADLILFVTSADRPFSESERGFMERIRSWSKKIVVVLNKVDLLASEREVEDQAQFVRQGAERLLGFSPELFPVSARLAMASRGESDAVKRTDLWRASRFDDLERFIDTTLDDRSRLALKLTTPLGVAERVCQGYLSAADAKLMTLAEDMALARSIERQLEAHRGDMRRDFAFRLEELENILHALHRRGDEFLDDTLRIGRVFDLFNRDRMRAEFENKVVADTAQRIDQVAGQTIDWIVDQDVKLWRAITDQVEQARSIGPGAPIQRLSGSFEYDRRALLGSLGQTARTVVAEHDHRREAEQLAESVRGAVAQTALIEVGAVGLGAVTMAILGSAAADVTGLFAAGIMAGFGFYVLPLRRRRARAQLAERVETLRERLITAMRAEFDRELDRTLQRVRDALAPYDRFIRAEHDETTELRQRMDTSLETLRALRTRAEKLPGH